MDLNTLFELVRGKSRGREKAKAHTWQALVARVADGKLADADELVKQLEHLGKTPDELTAAVERLTRRRAAAAVLDRAKGLGAKRETARQKITAAEGQLQADRDAAARKFLDTTAPLENELRTLDALERDARQAEGLLVDTFEDADVLTELGELERQLSAIHKAGNAVGGDANRDERKAGEAFRESELKPWGFTQHPEKAKALREKSKLLQADADANRQRQDEILAEARPIEARVEDLRRKMLAP